MNIASMLKKQGVSGSSVFSETLKGRDNNFVIRFRVFRSRNNWNKTGGRVSSCSGVTREFRFNSVNEFDISKGINSMLSEIGLGDLDSSKFGRDDYYCSDGSPPDNKFIIGFMDKGKGGNINYSYKREDGKFKEEATISFSPQTILFDENGNLERLSG